MEQYLDPQIIGLGLALGVGLLIGLERQWAKNTPIGLRSFALIGVSGGLAALLAEPWGGWLVAAGLLAMSALIAIHQVRHPLPEAGDATGTTTILAALAVYLIGAACVAGYQTEGVVMAGIVTLLLHAKEPMHDLVRRIGPEEFSAIIRFVLITLVVLPVLPNKTLGPFGVVNPFQVWLLAVLIVGLNLIGYVTFRLLGADSGAIIGGLVGGAISSTATTVSYAGMTRRNPDLAATAALIILLAATVVYVRIGVVLLALAPSLFRQAFAPMGIFALIMLAASAAVFPRAHRNPVALPRHGNPARLRVALVFAALFMVISVAVAAAREHLGNDAIYGLAFLSGLTNVDAMTVSSAQLFRRGTLEGDLAWRAIFLATLANLVFKVGAVWVLGDRRLRTYLLITGAFTLSAGTAILLLWP
jgi:uncharacterized membrane protein (DUF4010 family)